MLDKDVDVVGASVVETGFASGGANIHSSKYLNSTVSIATNPFPLSLRWTRNFIYSMQIIQVIDKVILVIGDTSIYVE